MSWLLRGKLSDMWLAVYRVNGNVNRLFYPPWAGFPVSSGTAWSLISLFHAEAHSSQCLVSTVPGCACEFSFGRGLLGNPNMNFCDASLLELFPFQYSAAQFPAVSADLNFDLGQLHSAGSPCSAWILAHCIYTGKWSPGILLGWFCSSAHVCPVSGVAVLALPLVQCLRKVAFLFISWLFVAQKKSSTRYFYGKLSWMTDPGWFIKGNQGSFACNLTFHQGQVCFLNCQRTLCWRVLGIWPGLVILCYSVCYIECIGNFFQGAET